MNWQSLIESDKKIGFVTKVAIGKRQTKERHISGRQTKDDRKRKHSTCTFHRSQHWIRLPLNSNIGRPVDCKNGKKSKNYSPQTPLN